MSIKLIECPRDAWQGLPRVIPTELKARYLRALIAAGFKHIDAVSFVSPKAVPQMADSEEVLAQIDLPNDVEIIGIVVNERGAERALATKRVTTLGFPTSVSPTFLRKNQNQSPEENFEVLRSIRGSGVEMVAYISMAFGNPYGDGWSVDEVRRLVHAIVDLGVESISLADTVGLASAQLIGEVMAAFDKIDIDIGIHMHSAPSDAVAKVLAAYDAGCRRFDSAIGGLGGCPFAQDALVGNIPTEKVIEALRERGVELPIDLSAVAAMNAKIAGDFAG
ncbi:MAG: hydroxymethylglutaryl-CoA lyase [Verrucomicrobiota bacterium]